MTWPLASPTVEGAGNQLNWEQFSTFFHTSKGDPENVIAAQVGSIYLRQDGGAGTTLYVKESGTGNTGWVAK